MILKDKIYVYSEQLGSKEFDSIHDLIKEYFRMNVIDKVSNFEVIQYLGYELNIYDSEGDKDSFELIEEIENQIKDIHSKVGE